ncbi:hypothetical protein ABT337_27435 [Saccharopolyspora hirsuta]|uniref:DUF3800 domain-containing protein n=1 Tax=Saccharopolyspora hirsuta TaxID=1837 RepID=A0A5M7C4X8_SACHI|nr:hypothetical protein [Saccharopolyspora hirsuta]KAA5837052.1 hypothetical protein F1721_04315 [Saccharopolyspora hirsuta]
MFVHAYVDESYDLTIGVYILTATIVDLPDADDFRYLLRSLQQGGEKLHWRKEPPSRRTEITKAIAGTDMLAISVHGHAGALRPERARRKCMEALLPELERAGVSIVQFEARQAQHNKHDSEMVVSCRNKRLITGKLSIDFAPGVFEPLLWLPDAVCGAMLAAQRGDHSYANQLLGQTQLIHIDAS